MSILVELPEDQYREDAFAAFDPAGEFSIGTARSMAWMSQLAYETRFPDKIERIGGLWGLREVRCLREPSGSTLPMPRTRGVLAATDEATILAFAGTDPLSLMNWITDFSLGRREAEIHKGFEAAAAAVWDETGSVIGQSMAAGRRLFVTGHSLGAAIAAVTVDRAAGEVGLGRSQTYLLGCPRVGRAAFAARYNEAFGATTYRLVHGKDVVAAVPPPELDFRHVGRYLACARGGKFDPADMLANADSDAPSPADEGVAGLFGRVAELVSGPLSRSPREDLLGQLSQILVPGIGDHLPDRYCAALG